MLIGLVVSHNHELKCHDSLSHTHKQASKTSPLSLYSVVAELCIAATLAYPYLAAILLIYKGFTQAIDLEK